MSNKQPTKKNVTNELNNLGYSYEQEISIDFVLGMVSNCFMNLLLMTGQDAMVVRKYIDEYNDLKGKELSTMVEHMYKTIKENKIDHPIGKQAHLEIAMKSLQAVINKIEIHFSKMLNISGLVDTDGSLIIAKDKKPS